MKIIYALDYNNPAKALHIIETLHNYVNVFKIGLELTYTHGLSLIIDACSMHNIPVILDVKLSDIDETMVKTLVVLANLYPNLTGITIRTLTDTERFKPLLKQYRADIPALDEIELIAVPSLTSDSTRQKYSVTDSIANIVKRVKTYGCNTIVCNSTECEFIKIEDSNITTIVTGIKPDWVTVEYTNHKKTITPAKAVNIGADYIIIEKAVHNSLNPVSAMKKIIEEIADAIF